MADEALARVQRLAEAGRFDEAATLLLGAAGGGDGDALFVLALWRVQGSIVRRDLPAARRLLGEAAAAGHRDAALIHANFLANGTGGAADWDAAVAALERAAPWSPSAAAQLRLLAGMDLAVDGRPAEPPRSEPLSDSPRAFAARGLFSAAECAWLRDTSDPWLQPSVVVDPATRRMVPHPVRSSDGAMFGVVNEDPVVSAINRRIAALSGTALDAGEPLQVLRYRPGGEYKPHLDGLPGEANQRIVTVLVYLTDDYRGGETVFVRTGLSFRGQTGDALMFFNALPDGRPDPASLHAGLPVRSGVKTIASRWIRQRRFDYPAPAPATGN